MQASPELICCMDMDPVIADGYASKENVEQK